MGTLIVGIAVLAVATIAARKIYKDKKNGSCCGGCSGNCSGCHGSCHTD